MFEPKRIVPCVALALALAPAAQAGKFYVGAGAGSSNAELPGGTTRIDFDDTGYKAFVGYRVLRYLSAELAYTDFGSPSVTTGSTRYEADLELAALWAVGVLALSPRLELYGRLGYTDWDAAVTVDDGTGAPVTDDGEGNDLGWGVGAGYNLTPRWALQLDWENYELEDADEVTFTSLAVRFRF